jgi:hypothetical protein
VLGDRLVPADDVTQLRAIHGMRVRLSDCGYHQLKGDVVIEPHMATRERDPREAAQAQAVRAAALRGAGLGTTG